MGIIQQRAYEKQLSAYLDGTSANMDVAWHTLRNAIYATGCRIHLLETQTFHQANQTAWRYFENALTSHTQTLLFKTSLTSVQALTVMAGCRRDTTRTT